MSNGKESSFAPPRRSVLLGLFVVFQLAFLVGHNLLSLVQELLTNASPETRRRVEQFAPGLSDKKGNLANLSEATTLLAQRYSQATLQLQSWSLFAPSIGRECVFPALLLPDDESPQVQLDPDSTGRSYRVRGKLVLSDNEPPDLTRYLRWGNFRLRRYENNLVVYLTPGQDESADELNKRFAERIKEHVTTYDQMLHEYLRWRLETIGAQPDEVILVMRRYHLAGPERETDFLDGPFTMPVARWDLKSDAAKLEYFNPMDQRFEASP